MNRSARFRIPQGRQETVERFFILESNAAQLVQDKLYRVALSLWDDHHDQLVLVAVGTDRSTGDALGPLVGSALLNHSNTGKFQVLGTLEEPVHATNLRQTLEFVTQRWDKPFIVALDACLGRPEHVGSVTVGPGPLQPGTGVRKSLPEVGDMHIKGTVNIGGFMEYFVLQNTRLSLVVNMADVIAEAAATALARLNTSKKV
jgi:putative sporulation protein YyaC